MPPQLRMGPLYQGMTLQVEPIVYLASDEILNLRLFSCRWNSEGALLSRFITSDKIKAGNNTIPTNPTTKVSILYIPPKA